MKNYRQTMFAALALVLAIPLMAFEPAKNLTPGTIHLKNGEVLSGLMSPLGKFAETGTVFRADKQSPKMIIAHDRIEKIVLQDRTLIPGHIPVGGKGTPAYLEVKTSGSAILYKAHYYALKQLGKNNAAMQMQWTWVLQSPQSGPVNLGHQPKPSELAQYLHHPLLKEKPVLASNDEAAIIKAVEDHNSAVRSILTGIPNEEMKQGR